MPGRATIQKCSTKRPCNGQEVFIMANNVTTVIDTLALLTPVLWVMLFVVCLVPCALCMVWVMGKMDKKTLQQMEDATKYNTHNPLQKCDNTTVFINRYGKVIPAGTLQKGDTAIMVDSMGRRRWVHVQ